MLWLLLVRLGWAQTVIDFIFWIHFIKPVYIVEAFNFSTALLLILVTASIGYALGWGFTTVWNKLHK